MSATIRPETPTDHEPIRAITAAAFGGRAEVDLIDALRGSPAFDPELSLVAELDGELVGHLLLSAIAVRAARGSVPALALGPMAVRPDRQRAGIGSSLVRHGLERAARLGHGIAIVLGHPDYYPRFGFRPAGERDIRSPWDVPANAWMVRELIPGRLSGVSGPVEYPAPWGATVS